MADLMRYAAALEGLDRRALPPVEKWDPPRSGEIDIVIKSDGTWFHEGGPINRARLVRQFSTILRREGEDHFLVTPAEKLKITVEDAPFLAVRMNVEGEGEGRRIEFTTNLGDAVVAGPGCRLEFRPSPAGDIAPYIDVRRSLEARIGRAVYYDLVALGERRHMGDVEVFGAWSNGEFFPFADAGDIDD